MLKNILMSILVVLILAGVLSAIGIFYWALDATCQFALVFEGKIELMEALKRCWNLHLLWILMPLLITLLKVPGVVDFIDKRQETTRRTWRKLPLKVQR
jgi:hypothetical protein